METDIKKIVSHLLSEKNPEALMIYPITVGKNNRAYHIARGKENFFLKHYNPAGERNRLLSEYQFSQYASQCTSLIAKPIKHDPENLLGLYEFYAGERYQPHDIAPQEIQHAIQFIKDINQTRTLSPIHLAQEACFSIQEHIEQIDRRIQKLLHIVPQDLIDKNAVAFIKTQLHPAWQRLQKNILARCDKKKWSLDEKLSEDNRIISPSDFGFHNALKIKNGGVIFVDFEYAGWDDPAKLIGDFFHQVDVPIPMQYFDTFSAAISQLTKDKDRTIERTRLLFPLCCIKWCCIILNYFDPKSRIAKTFTNEVTQALREAQLEKAKLRLQHIDRINL